jgi:CBS domain-containing protein
MPRVDRKNFFSGIFVKEAMRRQVIQLPQRAPIDYCINRMIKYKISSILLVNEKEQPIGVVSKTDIVGAFYAGLPTYRAAKDIMIGPVLFCYPDDELETALDTMQQNGIHRLYVLGADAREVVGVLAYPDIMGLLYRYCRVCDKGFLKSRRRGRQDNFNRLKVQEVMTSEVVCCDRNEDLAGIIEGLTAHRFGAVLIRDSQKNAVGVVSKSDLVVAYKHGLTVDAKASVVMGTPVHTCEAGADLAEAIQLMLVKDVQRIFVCGDHPDDIVGILSLSDAARFRSGTCRACAPSRLLRE